MVKLDFAESAFTSLTLHGSTCCFDKICFNPDKKEISISFKPTTFNEANWDNNVQRTGSCGYRTLSSQTPFIGLSEWTACIHPHIWILGTLDNNHWCLCVFKKWAATLNTWKELDGWFTAVKHVEQKEHDFNVSQNWKSIMAKLWKSAVMWARVHKQKRRQLIRKQSQGTDFLYVKPKMITAQAGLLVRAPKGPSTGLLYWWTAGKLY